MTLKQFYYYLKQLEQLHIGYQKIISQYNQNQNYKIKY
jgi:hypothetical protein